MLTELGNIFKSIFAWQNERGALNDVIRGIIEPRPIQIEHTNSFWTISSRILCSSAGELARLVRECGNHKTERHLVWPGQPHLFCY